MVPSTPPMASWLRNSGRMRLSRYAARRIFVKSLGEKRFASTEDLIAYLRSGEKPPERWRVGTEHEKIGYTQDDGIDTGGSPNGYTTNTTARSCWFESILHEGAGKQWDPKIVAALFRIRDEVHEITQEDPEGFTI